MRRAVPCRAALTHSCDVHCLALYFAFLRCPVCKSWKHMLCVKLLQPGNCTDVSKVDECPK
jgi:hypothetical protein